MLYDKNPIIFYTITCVASTKYNAPHSQPVLIVPAQTPAMLDLTPSRTFAPPVSFLSSPDDRRGYGIIFLLISFYFADKKEKRAWDAMDSIPDSASKLSILAQSILFHANTHNLILIILKLILIHNQRLERKPQPPKTNERR
ncbi:hypothetical protein EYC84_010832 [Monilinia fructicola]|uniref:Uncharacterized protein n=1 Tax=Monilinia fructicola TaxID=38448 RepID=A0A5M9J6F3_MONFR|nr:hypothetical protein EYC84_010832 [Monilinia fructicola]